MKPGFRTHDDLFAEFESERGEGDDLAVWWLGQSGFLVKSGGVRVLFDPYLSDSLTRKYDGTDKPHVRLTEQVIDPRCIEGLVLITSSHNHTDHLDRETLLDLAVTNPGARLALPAANREFARERLGGEPLDVVEMDAHLVWEFEGLGLQLIGVAAAHNEVERDELGRCRYLGYVLRLGSWTIYHSGDTLWHPDLTMAVAVHRPDLSLLPINGNRPERRVAGNLNGAEAAALARATGSGCVIPCHYDMFAFNTETPDRFESTCRSLDQPYRILENGQGATFAPKA